MRFEPTSLPGVLIVEPEPVDDERGFFARLFCRREFAERGLESDFVQCSVSFNARRGTLRGMHYQRAPHDEAKLIRCTAGAIFDAVVDLRPDSATRGRWFATDLTARNGRMLYVPKGFAHGFQTLEDNSAVLYFISTYYAPESSTGFLWNDPGIDIRWPVVEERVLSDRDLRLPRWPP